MKKMLEEFELWAKKERYDLTKHTDGRYVQSITNAALHGWKASRAALCIDVSKAYQQGGMMADYLVESALE